MAWIMATADKPLTDNEFRDLMPFLEKYDTHELLSLLFQELDKYDENQSLRSAFTDNQKMQALLEIKAWADMNPDIPIEDIFNDIIYTLVENKN